MSIHRKAWAISGAAHLAILFGIIVGVSSVASGQGQLPIGENRPIPKAVPVKSNGIAPVALENMTPASKSPETVELKPGQLKAFASGDGVSWDLVPKSDDATDDGLVLEEAAPGTVIFGYQVDAGKWGKFKVPDGSPVILIACNPEAKGKYLLSKMEIVGGKVKISERTYINVSGAKKPDPVVVDDKKKDTTPPPVPAKSRKLSTIVIEETADTMAKRASFFNDPDLLAHYKAKGHANPVIVDQDVKEGKTNKPPEKLVPYLNRAKGKPLPQVYLVDSETGETIIEGEITDTMTPKEFLELIKKAGG